MKEYLVQVIWLLSWPILIIVSYQVLKMVLKKYNKSPYSKSE